MTFSLDFYNPAFYYLSLLMSVFIVYSTYFKRHKNLNIFLVLVKKGFTYMTFSFSFGTVQLIGMIYISIAAGILLSIKRI